MEKNNEIFLAGCVVLYDPNSSVVDNIQSYLPFVNKLYIIDNSEKVNNELTAVIRELSPKVNYLPQYKNTGIASALNAGAALAFNENYSWLLTMDQDSYFTGSEFFNTWTDLAGDDKIGLIAASYTNEYDRWQKSYAENYNEIHFTVTSGNVISLKAWKNSKGFEEKLFIDEVDHAYCLNLRKNGYKILTSKSILMKHAIGEFYQEDCGDKKVKKKITIHTPVRYYYMSRNVLYLCKKYFFIDFKFVLSRSFYLIKTLARIILLYPDKLVYLRYYFAGVRDFILSRYNKYN